MGTIGFKNGQTILPPGIDARWVGIVLEGSVEMKDKDSRQKVLAASPVGAIIRAQVFCDGYYQMVSESKKKKKKKKRRRSCQLGARPQR